MIYKYLLVNILRVLVSNNQIILILLSSLSKGGECLRITTSKRENKEEGDGIGENKGYKEG